MTKIQTFFPLPFNAELGASKLVDFISTCQDNHLLDIEKLINQNNYKNLLLAIFSNSPYLSHLLFRDVVFARELLSSPLDKVFSQVMSEMEDNLPRLTNTGQFSLTLRKIKSKIALIISFADLSGQWTLATIIRSLSDFAELAVALSVSHLLRGEMVKGNIAVPPQLSQTPAEDLWAGRDMSAGTGYVVLAMGKMGGYELNYSSDIDLIVLYDNDIIQYTGRKTPQDLFIKITRSLVKIMQERTAEGYVFRTDLRLRPDPGATAIAISMEGAEIYYQSMGLNWERAAMIKARPVAGDIEAGLDFLSRIKSFVWRKHLDYAALDDIHSMKKLIHQHHGHQAIGFAGQDVKLGHGGIREIEFYAQIFQLISGGREPALRVAGTCAALNALVESQKLTDEDNQKLQSAYVYYRTLEHRLQMINDDQTHTMPTSDDDIDRITKFMGYDQREDFETAFKQHLNEVHLLFSNLLKDSNVEDDDEDNDDILSFPTDSYNQDTMDYIEKSGYQDPKVIYDIIQTWHLGRYRACRTERARKLLGSFIPEILKAFSKFGQPMASFKKFDRFLSRLPSGIQLFSFIKAHPWLLELLAEIIGIAPDLSDQLAKRPLLLDAVLNDDFFKSSLTKDNLKAHFTEQLSVAKDFQDILDISRKWASEHKFQVGVQILSNKSDAHTSGKNLSLVADIILEVMFKAVLKEFSKKHGVINDTEFAVVALGKLGGCELTTTSDLDLVFIYDAKSNMPFSDGEKSLSVNHYFSRLSQQFINSLTAMTGEGKLYEIDMRLRPSGNAGPIVVTIQTFDDYQRREAWTWEHLALIRARVVFGGPELTEKINQTISGVIINGTRDVEKTLYDTAEMREKLHKEFKKKDIWAVKYVRGGLVDIEFICQYLILKNASSYPEIMVANNLDQISRLTKTGVLSAERGDILYKACEFMQNIQVILRLCLGESVKFTPKQHGLIETLCMRFQSNNIDDLRQNVTKTQQAVYEIYREIIEVPAKEIIVPK